MEIFSKWRVTHVLENNLKKKNVLNVLKKSVLNEANCFLSLISVNNAIPLYEKVLISDVVDNIDGERIELQ